MPMRPFTKNDIPQVVKLFQKVFFNNGQTAPSSSNLTLILKRRSFTLHGLKRGLKKRYHH